MKTFLCAVCALAFVRGASAQVTTQESNALKTYDIVQYINVSGYGPQNIMLLDNNGDILLACKNGITEDSLRRQGTPYTQSQLVLLETWRVLSRSNDTLRTLVPILDSAQTYALRQYSRHVAELVSDSTAALVGALGKSLNEIKRSRSAYSIMFSYIADGLVWRSLEEKKLLTPRVIQPDRPFWAGEVWAMYRPRPFSSGTNEISDRGVSMRINWSFGSIPKMMPFFTGTPAFERMFDDFVSSGRVVDTAAKRVFGPFNLFDNKGEFTIPIIVETPSSKLYTVSTQLSQRITGALLNIVKLDSLRALYNFRDNAQTLVIVYHEIMWDLMDAYEKHGLMKKPAAFADPAKAQSSDISDLVFIAREEHLPAK